MTLYAINTDINALKGTFVPYTGATADVDLGAHNLTAALATFTDGLNVNTPTGSIILYGGAFSGTMDNIYIGQYAPSTGTFTDLKANNALELYDATYAAYGSVSLNSSTYSFLDSLGNPAPIASYGFLDGAGNTAFHVANKQINDNSNNLSIDGNGRQLIDAGSQVAAWGGFGGYMLFNNGIAAYNILDTSGYNAISVYARQLNDETGSLVADFGSGSSYGMTIYGGLAVSNIFPYGNTYVDFGSGGDVPILTLGLVDSSNVISVDAKNRSLNDSSGAVRLNYLSGQWYDSASLLSVQSQDRYLMNTGGFATLNWEGSVFQGDWTFNNSRFFITDSVDPYMGAGMIALDNYKFRFLDITGNVAQITAAGIWDESTVSLAFDALNRVILDTTTVYSIDAQNRLAYDSVGNESFSYDSRYWVDTNNVQSGNWGDRLLYGIASSSMLSWTGSRDSNAGISFDSSQNTCLSKVIAYYNNNATSGNGVTAIRGQYNVTANAAAIGATTLYAVPATNGAGLFRVSFVAKVTRGATTSSTLGGANGFRVIYTDQDDSVTVTTGNITNVSGATLTGNSTQVVYSGSVIINAKASTNIQFTFDYTSSGATTMQYSLHVRCEQI